MESEGQSPRLQMEWLGQVVIYSDHKVGRGQFVSPRDSSEEECWFPGIRALLVPSFSGGGMGVWNHSEFCLVVYKHGA